MTQHKPLIISSHKQFLASMAVIACLLSVTSISVSSCGEQTKGDTTQVVDKSAISREDVLHIIEGGWVNTEYAEALERVHSPMFAAESGRPVQEMYFDIYYVRGDTVVNGTGRLNYIEGERFDVVLFNKDGRTQMKIDQGGELTEKKPIYLDYEIGEDTTLILISVANNDTTRFTREFRKAPKKADVPQNALEHFVNRVLFEGEWKATDGSVVTFGSNGTVSGWDKWTWFSVEIDKYGIETQPDVMSVYNSKIGATYVYTLDNDRLSVYEYGYATGSTQWTRGKLVMELVKK